MFLTDLKNIYLFKTVPKYILSNKDIIEENMQKEIKFRKRFIFLSPYLQQDFFLNKRNKNTFNKSGLAKCINVRTNKFSTNKLYIQLLRSLK